ncbi:MAG: AzlD domain-containing protein [Betaproteobacteria bacterium]|nr:AzlD domain-containing protein [Betaproteobacteria bacterium]
MAEFTALVFVCGVINYLWRGAGVWLAKGLDVESELFRWVSCVAFAMIAGLTSRIILMPTGPLAATSLAERLAGTACALAVFYLATRRNLFAGVAAGALALVLLQLLLR